MLKSITDETPGTTFLFDREGDGQIDEVLKVKLSVTGLSTLLLLDKDDVQYFVTQGTNSDKYMVSNVEPKILSPEEREVANGMVGFFYR